VEGEPTAIRVQGRSGGPRGPRVVVAVLAAFLVVAFLKPWSFGGDGSTGARPVLATASPSAAVVASASPPLATPTAAPENEDPNAMPCLTDATDQVVMIERWAGHEVRSWVAAVDLADAAAGPLDPRLVPVTIFSSHVIGLGVCAPRELAASGPPAAELRDVEAVVERAGRPVAIDLGPPEPITWPGTGPEPAVLYGAPATAIPGDSAAPSVGPGDSVPPGSSPTLSTDPAASDVPQVDEAWSPWPSGTYSIAFRFSGDATGVFRWLRIVIAEGAAGSG
jgi:hypothetical protein